MLLTVVLAAVGAGAIGFIASILFTWASGKSAMWNIGFAVLIAVTIFAMLLLMTVLLTRRFST